jgi:hypothetical protein
MTLPIIRDISVKTQTLLLHTENEVFVFPEEVAADVNFAAGNPADTFGAWTEIVDTGAVTLSSKFAARTGYLAEAMFREYSVANEIYIVEISYGIANTIIGRVKLRSDWTYVLTLRSQRIPAGEIIYYRMKAETALATLKADFRYYYIP